MYKHVHLKEAISINETVWLYIPLFLINTYKQQNESTISLQTC
jgi:hypothetical protein